MEYSKGDVYIMLIDLNVECGVVVILYELILRVFYWIISDSFILNGLIVVNFDLLKIL